jgi:hypothetical protein
MPTNVAISDGSTMTLEASTVEVAIDAFILRGAISR